MTSLTAGLAANPRLARRDGRGDGVDQGEPLYVGGVGWRSCYMTRALRRAHISRPHVALPGVSAGPANWFLKTMITLSVTLGDSARACAEVSGGCTATGAAAGAAVWVPSHRRQRYGRHGYQCDGGCDRRPAQKSLVSHLTHFSQSSLQPASQSCADRITMSMRKRSWRGKRLTIAPGKRRKRLPGPFRRCFPLVSLKRSGPA